MGHQKLHLIRQNAAIAQDEILPQTWGVWRVQQGHFGLLGGAAAFAMIAGTASCHDVHPGVNTPLSEWNDMFPCEVFLMKMLTTIGANIAVASKQFDIGQPRLQVERIDVGYALGANNAVDMDDGLVSRDGIVTAVKGGHLSAHFPAHLVRSVVQHSFFQADPRLRQTLS